MTSKQIIINTSLSFTIITIISGILELQAGIMTTDYYMIFYRLLLCVIGFFTLFIFKVFKHLPLRFVQLIHYSISVSLIMLLVFISQYIRVIQPRFYLDSWISYTVVYCVIAFFYELQLRKKVKLYNQLLNSMKN